MLKVRQHGSYSLKKDGSGIQKGVMKEEIVIRCTKTCTFGKGI
jgi:hypothetical protein